MFLILLGELILLYVLSQLLTRTLYRLFLLLFRARSVAIMIVLLLEFPGTVVHELSHLFTASILGVPTGKITLTPEVIRDPDRPNDKLGSAIRPGSVMIAHSDPFRRYAIGLAPVFAGILVLCTISYFFPGVADRALHTGVPVWKNTSAYLLAGLAYLLFSVSNTMFSSEEDLKGFWPFGIALILFIGAAYALGVRIALSGLLLDIATNITKTLVNNLGAVLILNLVLLILGNIFINIFSNIFHRRIVS